MAQNIYSSLSFSRAGRCFSDLLWTIMPGWNVMGSVPCACGGYYQHGIPGEQQQCAYRRRPTYLHVLLGSLLPLLGHGARSYGVGEETGDGEDTDGGGNDTANKEEDLATLIRRRGAAGAVGTESNVVCCARVVSSCVCRWSLCLARAGTETLGASSECATLTQLALRLFQHRMRAIVSN